VWGRLVLLELAVRLVLQGRRVCKAFKVLRGPLGLRAQLERRESKGFRGQL
jgi:hypothetical protein